MKLPWPVVDIRDVAKVHVRALAEKEEEADEVVVGEGEGAKKATEFVIPSGRYLVNSGTLSLREILDQVRDLIWRPLMRISVPKPFLWVGFYTGFVGNKLSKDDIVHNIGNRRLRVMVAMRLQAYEQLSNFQRMLFIQDFLRSLSGVVRFIALDLSVGKWRLLKAEFAMQVIQKHFDECLRIRYSRQGLSFQSAQV